MTNSHYPVDFSHWFEHRGGGVGPIEIIPGGFSVEAWISSRLECSIFPLAFAEYFGISSAILDGVKPVPLVFPISTVHGTVSIDVYSFKAEINLFGRHLTFGAYLSGSTDRVLLGRRGTYIGSDKGLTYEKGFFEVLNHVAFRDKDRRTYVFFGFL